MEAYYRQHMNKERQSVYHAMKTGFTALAPSFPVLRLDAAALNDVFFQLRLDCPEIFYVSGFSYRFYRDADHVELIPQYLFDKGKIRDHQQAMSARVTKLCRAVQSKSEAEKEQYIHDFLCENVRYDKLKKPYSHEIIGPLGQGVGVCEGIAKSAKILCDNLGIWCAIAISDAAPDQGIKYRHAWNVVKIGGVYRHLDVTFDLSLSREGLIRHDYYNLSDQQILRDHQPLLYPMPACPAGDGSFYRQKKLSFTKMEEVENRTRQAVRKKKPLLFQWRGGYLTREVLKELMDLMERTAQEKGRHVRVSLNWPQAVLLADFPEELPSQTVVSEEANEGELLDA